MSSSALAKKQFLAPEGSACHLYSSVCQIWTSVLETSISKNSYSKTSSGFLRVSSLVFMSNTSHPRTQKLFTTCYVQRLELPKLPSYSLKAQVSSASEVRRIAIDPNGNNWGKEKEDQLQRWFGE